MSVEEAAGFFRIKESLNNVDPKSHKNWESVLEKLKSYNPNDGCFYMIASHKGSENETRSRFLSYEEAIKTVMFLVAKNK